MEKKTEDNRMNFGLTIKKIVRSPEQEEKKQKSPIKQQRLCRKTEKNLSEPEYLISYRGKVAKNKAVRKK